MKTSITILFFLLQVSCNLLAYNPQSLNGNPVKADSASIEKYPAKNVIYVDVATALVIGYANLSYERLILEELSIRIGFGYGYLLRWSGVIENSQGFNLMAIFLTSKQSSKFEFGIGISDVSRKYNSNLTSAISLGYRYQPIYGGFVFRIGATWMGWGSLSRYGDDPGVGGLHVSFGYAF